MQSEKQIDDWLNFRHMYAFWMVARAGSFTRAARQMHVAQSAVSSQVASLEEYLDEPLLLRTNRSVELTPAGTQLLSYAHGIFAQSRAINTLFRDKERLRSSQTLRVGVVGGVSRNFVYRLLDRFVTRYPEIHLSVSTGSYREMYDLLKRFELQSIISLELPKKEDLGEVAYEKLGESEMCIVATPELIRKIRRKPRKKRKTGRKTAARKKAARPLDVFKYRHPFEVDVMGKHVRPQVNCELELRMDTDDIPLLRFFANSGKGIAVLPRVGVLQDLEAGLVDSIPLARCPEVMIYGITMMQAHPVLDDGEGAFALWSNTREPSR